MIDLHHTSVLVLMGGPDAERAVSIESGQAVANALRDAGVRHVAEAIIETPTASQLRTLARQIGADVIFPALHGPFGEGGPLQERLEAIGIPYVGATPLAAALAMDKMRTKRIVEIAGVPTPDADVIASGDTCPIELPLVLKPVDDGSSVDLRIVRTTPELDAARADLHQRHERLLAERYVRGRELTIGMVAGDVLPLIEIVPKTTFYDYDAKYRRDDTEYVVAPADLAGPVTENCADIARLAWRALGIRDLARVDVILDPDDNTPWFLELNTMPGFTSHSLLPMAARGMGLEMPELATKLVGLATRRATDKVRIVTTSVTTRPRPPQALS